MVLLPLLVLLVTASSPAQGPVVCVNNPTNYTKPTEAEVTGFLQLPSDLLSYGLQVESALEEIHALAPSPTSIPSPADTFTVQDLFQGASGVSMKSGQFQYLLSLFEAGQTAPAAPGGMSLQYMSKSWREGAAGDYPAWPRAFGPEWRTEWDECLLDPEPGEEVSWICPFGLAVTLVPDEGEEKSGLVTVRVKSGEGWRFFSGVNQAYLPGPDGTRLLYEYPPGYEPPEGSEDGLWFREYPDGSRVEYEPALGSGTSDWRVRRYYHGAWADPEWEVIYAWDSQTGRLSSITDTRGVCAAFSWQGSGSASRASTLTLTAPWLQQGQESIFRYRYNGSNRLERVLYPALSFTFDWNHDNIYGAGEALVDHHPAVRFVYAEGSLGHITQIWREAFDQPAAALPVHQNLIAKIDYDPTTGVVTSLAEPLEDTSDGTVPQAPGLYRVRTYVCQNDTVTETDPLGRTYTCQWAQWSGTSTVLQRSVVRITHTPSQNDPRPSAQARSWTLSWEGLRLLQVKGPFHGASDVGALSVAFTYDTQGRNLVTGVTVTPRAGSSESPISRTWTWSDWGSSFEDAQEPWRKRLVSRLTGYQDASGRSFSVGYVWAAGVVTATVTLPVAGTFQVAEDALGRVIWRTEPTFAAGVPGGGAPSTSGNKVVYVHGTSSGPGLGLVTQVKSYKSLSETEEVRTEFSYAGLGHLVQVDGVASHAGLTRSVGMDLDQSGRVSKVYLPLPGTGARSQAADLEFTRDMLGRVVFSRRRALDAGGNAYTNQWLESWTYHDVLGRRTKQIVERCPMGTASDPSDSAHWLEFEWTWDLADRVSRIQGPMYEQTAQFSESVERLGVHEILLEHDDEDRPWRVHRRLHADTQVGDEWSVREYGFDVLGSLVRAMDGSGLQVEFSVDGFGRRTGVFFKGTDGQGDQSVALVLDEEGRLLTKDLKKGAVVEGRAAYSRDGLGRVWRQELFEGTSTLLERLDSTFSGLKVRTVRDLLGRGKDYLYDPMGRLFRVEDTLDPASGRRNATELTRNAAGEVTELAEEAWRETAPGVFDATPARYVTKYAHDFRSRLLRKERWGTGALSQAEESFEYDGLDRLVKAREWRREGQDLIGRKWEEYVHDALGREVARRIYPADWANIGDEVVLETAYEDLVIDLSDPNYPNGKLDLVLGTKRQSSDGRGNLTSWHFDRGGRLIEKRAPGYVSGPAHRWLYQYDPEGRLTQGQDGNQTIVALERDNLRRPVSRYAFPGNWPLSLMTTLESFGYDDLGRLGSATTRFADWNPLQNAHLVTVGMERDAAGKVLTESFRFMAMATGTEKVLASGYTAGQQVDGSFRRSLDYPSGFDVSFSPDGAGKLAGMEMEPPTGGGFVGLASYRYEGGRVLGRRLYRSGTNWLEEGRTLDLNGLLTGISVDAGALLDEGIVRDGRGHVERIRSPRPETVPGNPAEQAIGDAYLLDGFDRLVEAKLGIKGSDWSTPYAQITAWGDRKVAHALDKAQNRTGLASWDVQGTPTTTTYQPEATSNRYAAVGGVAQVHDGNGNLVWDGERYYIYDYLDRLCEVWVPESLEARNWAAKGLSATEVNLLGTTLTKGVDLNQVAAPGTGARTSTAVSGWVLVVAYGYDPHGRRVLHAEEAASFTTSWDGWERAEEYQDPTGEGAVWNPVRCGLRADGARGGSLAGNCDGGLGRDGSARRSLSAKDEVMLETAYFVLDGSGRLPW